MFSRSSRPKTQKIRKNGGRERANGFHLHLHGSVAWQRHFFDFPAPCICMRVRNAPENSRVVQSPFILKLKLEIVAESFFFLSFYKVTGTKTEERVALSNALSYGSPSSVFPFIKFEMQCTQYEFSLGSFLIEKRSYTRPECFFSFSFLIEKRRPSRSDSTTDRRPNIKDR